MSDLVERVRAKAAEARTIEADRLERHVAREWWTVNKPEGTVEVFFCPPQTADDVRRLYPGCGVLRA